MDHYPDFNDSPQAKQKTKSNAAELEVIFKDSTSSIKTNKELIKYFKNNLDSLNRMGIQFVWRIATSDEQKIYKERGIKNLPALVIPNGTTKYGVQNIIKEIGFYIQSRKKLIGNIPSLCDGMSEVSDEALYEYQNRMIGKVEDDDNPDTSDNTPDFRSREMDMMRRRKSAGMSTQDGGDGDGESDRGGNDPYRVDIGGRSDNIPMGGNPSYSLQKLRGQGGGYEKDDIDLMQMQLDKMDPTTSMDYM